MGSERTFCCLSVYLFSSRPDTLATLTAMQCLIQANIRSEAKRREYLYISCLRRQKRQTRKRPASYSTSSLSLKDSYMASAALMRIQLENMMDIIHHQRSRAPSDRANQHFENEPSRSDSSSLNASASPFVLPMLSSNTSSDNESSMKSKPIAPRSRNRSTCSKASSPGRRRPRRKHRRVRGGRKCRARRYGFDKPCNLSDGS